MTPESDPCCCGLPDGPDVCNYCISINAIADGGNIWLAVENVPVPQGEQNMEEEEWHPQQARDNRGERIVGPLPFGAFVEHPAGDGGWGDVIDGAEGDRVRDW